MTTIQLRIELPAYSHSFHVYIPLSSNVQQVKEEISKSCPGQPRTDGQRLIWRGRNLGNEERVNDLWKSPSDPRILHLAVHPSSWMGQPPQVPNFEPPAYEGTPLTLPLSPPTPSGFSSLPTHPLPTPAPFLYPATSSFAPPAHRPIPFIAMKHQSALNALVCGVPSSESTPELRDAAKSAIEGVGWLWPTALDEPYPEYQPGGLRYDTVFIDGRHYLSLADSTAVPTPVQRHALNVLSYTFSLLNLSVTQSTIIARTETTYTDTNQAQVNQYLQQMGFPQLRVVPQAQNPNPNQNDILPQLRELPLRPLMMPIFMLAFRTLLLLYFVAPTRKPIFGILILAWMLYEIWQPIRNGLIRARIQRVNNINNGPQNGDPAAPEALNNVPQAQPGGILPAVNPQQPPFVVFGARQLDAQAAAILDALGNLNLPAEEEVINQAHLGPIPEPGWSHKLTSFIGLLLGTLHPAVWNRRRAALNRREGAIRTEANMRREPGPRDPNEEETDEDRSAAQARQELRERHARRPRWVQRYMERVVAEEWVDDLD